MTSIKQFHVRQAGVSRSRQCGYVDSLDVFISYPVKKVCVPDKADDLMNVVWRNDFALIKSQLEHRRHIIINRTVYLFRCFMYIADCKV